MSEPFIHATAIVETDDIGEGTRVWAYAHVLEGARVGRNCNVGDHCFIEGGATVGDNVTIKNGNMVWEGVTLEDGVFVGPHVFFTNDLYPRSPRLPQAVPRYEGRSWLVPTVVRRGASLGAGAILLAGCEVGEYAMVGAGAVVTHDVPRYALVIGNPARRVGWVCQCGQRIRFSGGQATCESCGRRYALRGSAVEELAAEG